jgi:hypothetical protein
MNDNHEIIKKIVEKIINIIKEDENLSICLNEKKLANYQNHLISLLKKKFEL